jgi:hypothetical protein
VDRRLFSMKARGCAIPVSATDHRRRPIAVGTLTTAPRPRGNPRTFADPRVCPLCRGLAPDTAETPGDLPGWGRRLRLVSGTLPRCAPFGEPGARRDHADRRRTIRGGGGA